MPELPEVNTVQQYFNATSLHQNIEQVLIRDDHVIRDLSGDRFAEKLRDRRFTGSYRRGKFLFGCLDNGHHVQLHLGMSGDLKYYLDKADEPRYARFIFRFDNGYHLAFDCPRKLARIRYIDDLEAYLQKKGLGEDAQRISEADFLHLSEGRNGTVKGFLMNQRYLAGVGNLYADEICYQARVHPASRTGNIPETTRRELYRRMQKIFAFAVEKNAHYRHYPEDWLWKWRETGHPGPDGNGQVKKMRVAGRTTYFVEGWQKKY